MKTAFVVVFNVLILVCGILPLAGCQEYKQEHSDILHEDAEIVEAVYPPSRHNSEIGLSVVKVGGVGLDLGGNLGIRVGGGLQISDSVIPEKFAVVFKCRHGQFIVSRRQVYDKFKDQKGKAVDVSYREAYLTIYETKDGKRQVVKRSLTDYNFLDATLK